MLVKCSFSFLGPRAFLPRLIAASRQTGTRMTSYAFTCCFALALLGTLVAAAPDCSSCELTDSAVCGQDGLEYQNACLATCQGIAVVHGGSCQEPSEHGRRLTGVQVTRTVTEGRASYQEMTAMRAQGYNLIGRQRTTKYKGPPTKRKQTRSDESSNLSSMENRHIAAVYRTDSTVDVYAKATTTPIEKAGPHVQQPYIPPEALAELKAARNTASRRSLIVLGKDDRKQISKHAWPYQAIAFYTATENVPFLDLGHELSFENPQANEYSGDYVPNENSGEPPLSKDSSLWNPSWGYAGYDYQEDFSCTSSLISRGIAITAAHCVYDFDYLEWSDNRIIVPGALNETDRPVGRAKVVKAVIYKQYFKTGAQSHDIAVLYLDKPVGKKTGYFGVAYDCGMQWYNLHVTGYPGDEPTSTMWDSSCTVKTNVCTEELMYHTCDTVAGNSGSGLYDPSTYIIRAVHTLGLADYNPPINAGVPLRPATWSIVQEALIEDNLCTTCM